MAISHFAYNMMKIPSAWGVIRVKADSDDAIYCVQKLNQTVAATRTPGKMCRMLVPMLLSGAEGTPGARRQRPPPRGRHSAATRR